MATVPNFGALAQQQQQANDDASRRTTWASRPDQTSAMGSVTWNQTPDGRWINNTTLAGGAQNLFDETLGWQSGLGSRVGAGAPEASFGAQQNVIDAWNALQEPLLQKQANADRARAAAMGITLGSEANNDIERNIGTNAATSRNQGILQGVNAWNSLYDRQLAGYNANTGAMGAMTGVRDSLNPNKWMSSVPSAAAYTPQTIYGSAMDTFNAELANENKQAMQSAATTSNIINGIGGAADLAGSLYNIWKNW